MTTQFNPGIMFHNFSKRASSSAISDSWAPEFKEKTNMLLQSALWLSLFAKYIKEKRKDSGKVGGDPLNTHQKHCSVHTQLNNSIQKNWFTLVSF